MPKKIKLLSIEEDKVSVVDENGAEIPDEPEPTVVAVEKPITDIEEGSRRLRMCRVPDLAKCSHRSIRL